MGRILSCFGGSSIYLLALFGKTESKVSFESPPRKLAGNALRTNGQNYGLITENEQLNLYSLSKQI